MIFLRLPFETVEEFEPHVEEAFERGGRPGIALLLVKLLQIE